MPTDNIQPRPPSFLQRVAEAALEDRSSMPPPNPVMRLLEHTQPCYARFLKEMQRIEAQEARAVDRANSSAAFPFRSRPPGT